MKWTISPADRPNSPRVGVSFEPDETGSSSGRATLVHLTPDAAPAMAATLKVLTEGTVEVEGLLWTRHVGPPHTVDNRQLASRLEVLAAGGWHVREGGALPHVTEGPALGCAHRMVTRDVLVACELALHTVTDPHANLRVKARSHLLALRALVDLPDVEGSTGTEHQAALRHALDKLFGAARADRSLIPFLDELHAHIVALALPMRQALRGEGPDDHKLARYVYGEVLDRAGGAWMSWRLATRGS